MDPAALRRLVEARLALHEREMDRRARAMRPNHDWLIIMRARRSECKAILAALDAMEAAAPAPAERGPA